MIPITDKEFNQLAAYIKGNYGINLKEEKRTFVMGRLQNILVSHNFSNFSDYFAYIGADKTGNAARTLIDRVTTNHTFFMREIDHFNFFKNEVLPQLVKTAKYKDLRIWSAGCSSGEEPVTLAMIVDEFLGGKKAEWDTKILATDISGKVLDKAKKGIYSNEALKPLPANWKMNYFNQIDKEHSLLADKIRNEIIYRKFNLMDKVFPFKRKFHVIFCRNVMIYFDQVTKVDLINKFYNLTEPGGYLFVGHSESLYADDTKYKYIMPAVYRKE